MSPTHDALILNSGNAGNLFARARWGLIPSWAKDAKIGYKTINARSETLSEKPAFREAYKKRRCIIPLSGFIEWKRDGEIKRPFRIGLKDSPIMSVAGLWESWKNTPETELLSFTIITTDANPFMSRIHERMPVILAAENEEEWLNPQNQDGAQLSKLLIACPDHLLAAYEISTLINSPKNNRKELLTPV